jgi:hypothetical protein
MGFRAFLNHLFPPPPPSAVIEIYLRTGRTRRIDDLFDGWVELDDQTFEELMAIHERYAREGDGFYGGLLRPEAHGDLMQLAQDLRKAGK